MQNTNNYRSGNSLGLLVFCKLINNQMNDTFHLLYCDPQINGDIPQGLNIYSILTDFGVLTAIYDGH
ncbi:hypothetical protein DSECCO2_353910 [anaerobic digester metagenome]